MSHNSKGMAERFISDLTKLKELMGEIQNRGEDPWDYDIEGREDGDSEPIKDPETGTIYWIPEPYGVTVSPVVYYTLAGGGPAMRLRCEFHGGKSNYPIVTLQHQDWFEPWQDYSPQNGLEEDALDWYSEIQDLTGELDMGEW